MDVVNLSIPELLNLHASVLDELKHRGVLRTKNNPVGDYAEWLIASALGLSLAKNSSAGHDAESAEGKRVQIKSRRITASNRSRQLGVIRNLDQSPFDELVAVLFNERYDVVEAYSIPCSVIPEYSKYRSHVNGHVLHARGPLLQDARVKNISDLFLSSP